MPDLSSLALGEIGVTYDLVVIGMGSGGIVAAELAAELGLAVGVVERDRVGGDCLWTGCVPSKALIASASVANTARHAGRFGVSVGAVVIDRRAVWERVRAVQAEIAGSDDDPDRYRRMGIDMFLGEPGVLEGPQRVRVGARTIEARFILLSTGSRPAIPDIPGLHDVGFVTSETLFELDEPPESWAMIGGGPIGTEMAQAFTRLGMEAVLLQRNARILPRDDVELVDLLTEALVGEGVDLRLRVTVDRVARSGDTKIVHATQGRTPVRLEADELFVATGRRPNIETLQLDALGVHTTPRGIEVDDRMRTNVPSIYAIGDVAGRYRFTHAAAYEAATAVRNMFFPGSTKASALVPWCTFTDPELAHAGLTEAHAREVYGNKVRVWRERLDHNDRARAEGSTGGLIKLVTAERRLVGAHVLAPGAGEIVNELAGAIQRREPLDALALQVHVYPTVSTSIQRAAGALATERARRWRWLLRGRRR